MVTRLEVYKLALKELMRQRYDDEQHCAMSTVGEESLANLHSMWLQKDIQYVREHIVDLERGKGYDGEIKGGGLNLLEVSKLTLKELLRQRKDEQVKYLRPGEDIVTDRLKKLDKDISVISQMINILTRAEQDKLKYKTTTHQ